MIDRNNKKSAEGQSEPTANRTRPLFSLAEKERNHVLKDVVHGDNPLHGEMHHGDSEAVEATRALSYQTSPVSVFTRASKGSNQRRRKSEIKEQPSIARTVSRVDEPIFSFFLSMA